MCHRLNLKIRGGGRLCHQPYCFGFKGHCCHSWNGLVKQAQGTHRSAKGSIKLTISNRNELEYIAKSVVNYKGAANCVKLNQLDVSQGHKVPVVNEFLCLFLRN
jgi:hypothetical protein